ncbi:hypothetical protein DPMN_188473 [Dreissena polymorpha]|uniref:Uncharacterized protein n=1 Tax=Dreissena polymorpha TaxID=45954 RepID=A0A9D4DRC8_DREPO|nr:hypothetical protein DPMN_188473 [Dreissena polymorpha]
MQKLLDLHQENPPCTPNLEHGIYSCNITVTQTLLDLHQENPGTGLLMLCSSNRV